MNSSAPPTLSESEELDRYRKIAFPTLFIAIFTAMLGVGIISPLLPIYASQLGASGLWIGIIMGGFSLSRMIAMPFVGKLSDRHGRKGFIVAGLLAYSVFSLGYTMTLNVHSFTILRILHGLGSAMVVPVAMALIGEMSPPDKEGEYMGTITLAMFAGFGTGPLLGGLLKDRMGMAMNFYSLSLLSVIALVMVLFALPRRSIRIRRKQPEPMPYRLMLKSYLVRGLILYRFTNALARGGIIGFLPIYADRSLGLSPSWIGAILSVYILLISFLQRPFGKLADRMRKDVLVVGGTLGSAMLFILIPMTQSAGQLMAALIVMGLAGSASLPAATALTVQEGKDKGMGSMMAVFNVAFSAGLGLGPILGGLVADWIGLAWVFRSSTIILFLGIFSFVFFFRRHSIKSSG